MKIKLTCFTACILLGNFVSLAQDKFTLEASGAYQFLRSNSINVPQGWAASVNVPTNNWFGVFADFSGATKSELGASATLYTYGGGPQFSLRTHNVEPYFRVALGAAHMGASGYGLSAATTAFSVAPGGGADFRVSDHVWLRLGANYLFVTKNGVTVDGIQALAGITYKFGRRREVIGQTTPRRTNPKNPSPLQESARSTLSSSPSRSGMPILTLGLVAIPHEGAGAEIREVVPGGIAEMAGLHVGDVINAVDGSPIKTPMELQAAFSERASGTKVHLGYTRGYWQSETIVILK